MPDAGKVFLNYLAKKAVKKNRQRKTKKKVGGKKRWKGTKKGAGKKQVGGRKRQRRRGGRKGKKGGQKARWRKGGKTTLRRKGGAQKRKRKRKARHQLTNEGNSMMETGKRENELRTLVSRKFSDLQAKSGLTPTSNLMYYKAQLQ